MEQKSQLVRHGDFLFKYRNGIFPAVLVVLALLFPPATQYGGDASLVQLKDMIAVLVVLAGLALRAAVIGYRYIKRGGLNKKVYAENLVTDGFFAVCRNPLYVGNFLIYAGVLLIHGSLVVIFIGGAFFLYAYTAIVAAEEYFLRNEFGAGYADYCRDVPRWWMKWSRLKDATSGMKFNFGRVLAKDYSTIANAAITLMALAILKEYRQSQITGGEVAWGLWAGLMIIVVAVALIIRTAKKRGMIHAA